MQWRQYESVFDLCSDLRWPADEQVSALSLLTNLAPIHRSWRDGRFSWTGREIRTIHLVSAVRDNHTSWPRYMHPKMWYNIKLGRSNLDIIDCSEEKKPFHEEFFIFSYLFYFSGDLSTFSSEQIEKQYSFDWLITEGRRAQETGVFAELRPRIQHIVGAEDEQRRSGCGRYEDGVVWVRAWWRRRARREPDLEV